MPDIQCQTVTITIADDNGLVTSSVVPAYTVSPEALCSRIAEATEAYMKASAAQGAPVSLGDYVLYLIVLAAGDPRSVSADEVRGS